MPERTKDIDQLPEAESEKRRFPRMLTLAQGQEVLNVGMLTLYALLSSGELRGLQLGDRGYLARLLGWMRIVAGFTGQERRMQRGLSARFVRIVGRRCAVVGA